MENITSRVKGALIRHLSEFLQGVCACRMTGPSRKERPQGTLWDSDSKQGVRVVVGERGLCMEGAGASWSGVRVGLTFWSRNLDLLLTDRGGSSC